MIAVIDNYDSFTYNIVQYLGELGAETQVFRNDAISVESLARLQPEKLLISPGPGSPDTAGISMDAIEFFKSEIPILGICLGHQSIGQVFGGKIIHAAQIMHGKLSQVEHAGTGVFTGLQSPYTATRYHSLVIDPATLPDCLELTAWTQAEGGGSSQPKPSNAVDQAANDGVATRIEIMGVRHRELDIEGVQFHPESISSEYGHDLLQNFINR